MIWAAICYDVAAQDLGPIVFNGVAQGLGHFFYCMMLGIWATNFLRRCPKIWATIFYDGAAQDLGLIVYNIVA